MGGMISYAPIPFPVFGARSWQPYHRIQGHEILELDGSLHLRAATEASGRGIDSRVLPNSLIIKKVYWWRRRESNPITYDQLTG